MAKKKMTEEQEKELKLLKANLEMYKKTLEEAKTRGRENAVKQIENAMKDVESQVALLMKGKNIDAMKQEEIPQEAMAFIANNGKDEKSVFEILEEQKKKKAVKKEETDEKTPEQPKEEVNKDTETNNITMFNNVDANAQYDLVPLPSKGECYENKTDRLPVGFLTAYDENFITSPNLYKDGLVIDFLLKNKILNKDFDIDSLVRGDADAIILFLRATSYGVDFPIIVRDPVSGENIETNIDLSKIKMKDFTLKSDENGHFTYKLPFSGIEVKFKYLTRKEEKDLEYLSNLENKGIKVSELRSVVKTIKRALDDDPVLSANDKGMILNHTRDIEKWADELEKDNSTPYNKTITNRMEMQIMAINGNYERNYIRKAIMNMPARDSLSLRRYILDNEPGMDFEVEVERPQNLGGGSFKTFLEWDDSVFLNLA